VRVEDIIHNDERLELPQHLDAFEKAQRVEGGQQLRLNLKVAEPHLDIISLRKPNAVARPRKQPGSRIATSGSSASKSTA
jgi:hypothetical protein